MLMKKKKKLHKGKIDILGIEDPSNCYFEKGLLEITYKFESQSMFTARFIFLCDSNLE